MLKYVGVMGLMLLGPFLWAADAQRKTIYVDLNPAFVLNYGGYKEGRLKYLKTDVALRVSSTASENRVYHHMPQIRNEIVFTLSSAQEADVSSPKGKETLRSKALSAVQAVLEREEGNAHVENLVFTSFVVQR